MLLIFSACRKDIHLRPDNNNADNRQTKTQNVVVVIVDGLRFTEGWGDSTKKYIPLLAGNMAKNGVVNTTFYNNGDTYTSAGHTNITTGIYRPLDNAGNELPANPSVFKYWSKAGNNVLIVRTFTIFAV